MNWLRRVFLKIAYPFLRVIGKVKIKPKKRRLWGQEIFLIPMIKKGDIILVKAKGELTNLLIGGKYKHALIATGDGYLEAVDPTVRKVTFKHILDHYDYICVCRAEFLVPSEIERMIAFAESQIGKPYDYMFEPNMKAFYCSELATSAIVHAMPYSNTWSQRDIFGVKTTMPDDFRNATDKFKTVIER